MESQGSPQDVETDYRPWKSQTEFSGQRASRKVFQRKKASGPAGPVCWLRTHQHMGLRCLHQQQKRHRGRERKRALRQTHNSENSFFY